MKRRKFTSSLSEEEKKLWARATENITRLDSNQAATPRVRKSAYSVRGSDLAYYHQPARFFAPGLAENSVSLKDADPNWHQKLRRGRARPEARLDLHGMTRDKAFQALNYRIESAQKNGKRVILVVTGKGGRKISGIRTTGILKAEVPRWLSRQPLAGYITSFHNARTEHGGDGALYVVLKRKRQQGS